jgi:hypothetical protein
MKRFVVTTALLLVTATGASAQQWDAPLFFSPRPMDDLGLYYVNTDRDFGNDNANGLKLIWRQSGNLNLGVHVGTGDLSAIGESILIGGEFYGPLMSLAASTGLAMNWSIGLGAAFGELDFCEPFATSCDYVDFSIPVGVSIGLRLGAGGMGITPFVHPRASFDVFAVTPEGGEEETDTDFAFAADIGAEVSLGRSLLLRGAYSLGDRDAFGIGLALHMPRRVVAR